MTPANTDDVAEDPAGVSHTPVLLRETVEALAVEPNRIYIDGTIGGGGHAQEILHESAPDGRLLGLDADPAAIRRVSKRLVAALERGRLVLAQSHFEQMAAIAQNAGFERVDGILLDLGLSSFQLETAERGFAFSREGPLDMRFDPGQGQSAAELLNSRSQVDIADIIYRYGEEHRSRAIARAIVDNRPIIDTAQLAKIVEEAVGGRKGSHIHPATQTFQALRIAVNDELGQLEGVLPQTLDLLSPGGRLAVISFHSLEDRIVKHWMREQARSYIPDPTHPKGGYDQSPTLTVLTKSPIGPSNKEVTKNPRSRSAKLRVAERL